jgi:hypothetical protein
MMEVKNKARSARGVHDASGQLHMIAPGETKSIRLSSTAVDLLKRKASFLVYEKLEIHAAPVIPDSENEVNPDDDLTALRADAESLGVKVDGRWGADRIRAEIDKALGSADAVHNADGE